MIKIAWILSSWQVHKKICIPLPGIFQRGRLYKARSCGSIVRDSVNQSLHNSSSTSTRSTANIGETSNVRHSAQFSEKNRILSNCLGATRLLGSDGDINQHNTTLDSANIKTKNTAFTQNGGAPILFTISTINPPPMTTRTDTFTLHSACNNNNNNNNINRNSPASPIHHQHHHSHRHHHRLSDASLCSSKCWCW